MRDIRGAEGFSKPDFAVLKRLVQLGLPIALALFFEVTLFAVVALLVSPLALSMSPAIRLRLTSAR
nr:multi antimicrobial extrusion protein (Na(+)/drug antiporter) [Raoultella sp. NCTC 9187]